MESGNLANVLALTLIATAAMFLVISRQLRSLSGMSTVAAGLALFGVVFALASNAGVAPAGQVALDATAVAAVLLLRRGLLALWRKPPLRWSRLWLLLALYGVASAAAMASGGPAASDIVLELALAALFAWLAITAARSVHGDTPGLKLPLRLLATVLGLLSVLSFANSADALFHVVPGVARGSTLVFDTLLMFGALLLGPAVMWMYTTQLAHLLEEFSMRDPLTRLLNEKGFDDLLRRHFARRQHEPVTLTLVDVDQLRHINDKHGEMAGDDMLRMISVALESGLRADDLVARVGGEEFAIASVGGDRLATAQLAERLRVSVGAIQTGLRQGEQGEHVRCSVSLGLSRPFTDADQQHRAWAEAELSLRAAKDAGGNCVVFPND